MNGAALSMNRFTGFLEEVPDGQELLDIMLREPGAAVPGATKISGV